MGPGVKTLSAEVPALSQWTYLAAKDKKKIIVYDQSRLKSKAYNVREECSGIDEFFSTLLHEERHGDQIAKADVLVPTGSPRTPRRHGWSFNTRNHNHWDMGADGKTGAAGIDDDNDGGIDNLSAFGRGELGKPPLNDDNLLAVANNDNWPASWRLPQRGPGWTSYLESDAIRYSDYYHDEHKISRDDWGNSGKNHQTKDKWDD